MKPERAVALVLREDRDSRLITFSGGHPERHSSVIAGYGDGVDLDVIRASWSLRSLTAICWLIEDSFDPFSPGWEVDVLRSEM